MNIFKKTFFFFILSGLLICPGRQGLHAQSNDPITVFTSLAPVAFVIQEIGGELVSVHTLIPQGRDPHTFSPTPRQVVALNRAAIYFTVAMTFEDELLRRIGNPSTLHIVDCSSGITKLSMAHDNHHQHQADQGDPHIWLGIDPLAKMAQNISAALSQNAPQHQQQFQENLNFFLARLNKLQSELAGTLAPFKGRSFLVFHPSFGYFADSFGLIQEAVEIEGKSPSPQQLTALIKLARAKDITVIFVQPQFDKRAAERMAHSINAKVLTLDPLAANVFNNLQIMAEKIATSLGK